MTVAPLQDPKAGQPIWLSYTAAKRYEQCGYLQLAHKVKATPKAHNEKPFFKGRVLHDAAEVWLHRRGTVSLPDLIPASWQRNEAAVVAAGTVIWTAQERAETYASAIALAFTLEAMLTGMRVAELPRLYVEQKYRCWVGEGAGMFAQPDILAISADGTTGFLCELKSGTSYDPRQPPWYVAVIARQPEFAQVQRWYAVPIRPAVSPDTKLVPVGQGDIDEQVQRVRSIVADMHAGKWEANPGYYCSTCEAAQLCPTYQATYGRLQKGVVGLGR